MVGFIRLGFAPPEETTPTATILGIKIAHTRALPLGILKPVKSTGVFVILAMKLQRRVVVQVLGDVAYAPTMAVAVHSQPLTEQDANLKR